MVLSGGVQMSENGKRRRYGQVYKVEAVRRVAEEKRKVTEAFRVFGNMALDPVSLSIPWHGRRRRGGR